MVGGGCLAAAAWVRGSGFVMDRQRQRQHGRALGRAGAHGRGPDHGCCGRARLRVSRAFRTRILARAQPQGREAAGAMGRARRAGRLKAVLQHEEAQGEKRGGSSCRGSRAAGGRVDRGQEGACAAAASGGGGRRQLTGRAGRTQGQRSFCSAAARRAGPVRGPPSNAEQAKLLRSGYSPPLRPAEGLAVRIGRPRGAGRGSRRPARHGGRRLPAWSRSARLPAARSKAPTSTSWQCCIKRESEWQEAGTAAGSRASADAPPAHSGDTVPCCRRQLLEPSLGPLQPARPEA